MGHLSSSSVYKNGQTPKNHGGTAVLSLHLRQTSAQRLMSPFKTVLGIKFVVLDFWIGRRKNGMGKDLS